MGQVYILKLEGGNGMLATLNEPSKESCNMQKRKVQSGQKNTNQLNRYHIKCHLQSTRWRTKIESLFL